MLHSLFGNESVTQALLFLLVNQEGYPHQIARTTGLSLTPIQKGLERLEKGGILTSKKEGKSRIYFFDDQCCYIHELRTLLRKAYSNLSIDERKRVLYLPPEKRGKEESTLIRQVWQALKKVTHVTLCASPHGKKGKGNVTVEERPRTIIFEESGIWEDNQTHYRNVFQWTWDINQGLISLEHLRHGKEHPVFLFHLTPTKGNQLESLHPHLCGQDTYFGKARLDPLFFHLQIRTIGPRKDEVIEYAYA